jgi:hypothetical protein
MEISLKQLNSLSKRDKLGWRQNLEGMLFHPDGSDGPAPSKPGVGAVRRNRTLEGSIASACGRRR